MILSGWETVFFWIFAISAILAGLLTVMARNAVHSALFLISSLVSVGALFICSALNHRRRADSGLRGRRDGFVLFVIMLVNVGAEEEGRAPIFNRPAQVAAALIFSLLLVLALLAAINKGYAGLKDRDAAALKQTETTRSDDQRSYRRARRV